ncbi:MAG: hypothetical protein J6X18_12535 [Bacteroidales bacterium]|nr:hypothetical protein [Bacteroidales bacterium]
MLIDWTAIIIAILSGTTLGGVVEAIRYRRENKRQKEAETEKIEKEVKDYETDIQMKEMTMADKYFKGMMEMLEQVKTSQASGNVNQETMLKKLTNLDDRMDTVVVKVSDIERYLNGDYKKWLTKQVNSGNSDNE